jgi:hypothetical protein
MLLGIRHQHLLLPAHLFEVELHARRPQSPVMRHLVHSSPRKSPAGYGGWG